MYDIAIVGLGPAGAVLAKNLSKGLKIIAIDKKPAETHAVDGGFMKPCGGMLAPDAQKSFSRFDMALPKDILVNPQIFSVKTIDLKSSIVRYYQRYYINMDRDKFDRWLISAIPSSVEVVQGAVCTAVTRQSGGFEIVYSKNGQKTTITTKYVIGADGANSAVRRALYPNFKINTYMAIQQWFKDEHPSPFYSCIFDPAVTPSYAWGLTKDDSFIFGGAFHMETARQDFETLKQKLTPHGFVLASPIKTEACMVLHPFGLNNYCLGTNGVFLVGEAAGLISPTSLEGISHAIDSAYILSQCINGTKAPTSGSIATAASNMATVNSAYRHRVSSICTKLFVKYLKYPFMYQPNLRRLVMKSGIASLKMAGKQ